ncbi:hypothetical protein K458DRAFT_306148, partial [Lentithecium fluviatile CBS 122367]
VTRAALNCRYTLETYLEKANKYEHSLGVWSRPSLIRGVTDKVRWGLNEKDEIRKLREYLNAHNNMINTSLSDLVLENMDEGFSKLEISGSRIEEITEDIQQSVVRIEESVIKQESMIASLGLSIPKLIYAFVQDVNASWEKLTQMLNRVDSTEQIYAMLVQIQASTSTPDTRWTFFQQSVVVEDAFGVKFPFISEYGGTLLPTIVRHRFLEVVSPDHIKTPSYFFSGDSGKVLDLQSLLRPGQCITVAVLTSNEDAKSPRMSRMQTFRCHCRVLRWSSRLVS